MKPFLRIYPVFLAIAFGSFLTSMDASRVVAMLPIIRQKSGIGTAGAGLIAVAELVTTAGLLLTCGRLGDEFGHKRAYLTLSTFSCQVVSFTSTTVNQKACSVRETQGCTMSS